LGKTVMRSIPSALIIDNGRRVLLRLEGHFYDLTQEELRLALGLPAGSPGLGITIEGERLHFEFPADNQSIEISASQLQRRLAKQLATRT
jgi:hypothetical protein